jgi:hypothetical protein
MFEYSADIFKLIRSKIGRGIGLLVFIQTFFIITSLAILSYYQSQMTYLVRKLTYIMNIDMITMHI